MRLTHPALNLKRLVLLLLLLEGGEREELLLLLLLLRLRLRLLRLLVLRRKLAMGHEQRDEVPLRQPHARPRAVAGARKGLLLHEQHLELLLVLLVLLLLQQNELLLHLLLRLQLHLLQLRCLGQHGEGRN